jgi:hypothetical protein
MRNEWEGREAGEDEADQDHFNLWGFTQKEFCNKSHSKIINPTDGIGAIEFPDED